MNTLHQFLTEIDIWEIIPAFVFLIAIIDPFGNIPITIAMEKKGVKISAWRVCLASLLILLAFLFAGEWILMAFGVQIEYFAIAGGFVIFLMAMEMVLDVTIFQNDKLEGEIGSGSSIVPLAFPMYAGPGAFTALLAITVDYKTVNLCIALLLCMIVLYIVLVGTHWLTKFMGNTTLYIIRKFFGIIVLAISCNLMFGNLVKIFKSPAKQEAAEVVTDTQTESIVNTDTNEEFFGNDDRAGQ